MAQHRISSCQNAVSVGIVLTLHYSFAESSSDRHYSSDRYEDTSSPTKEILKIWTKSITPNPIMAVNSDGN